MIRLVLEYCSVVWHHGLIKAQAESLESIQHRALRIIYPVTFDFTYEAALSIAQMASLFDHQEQLNRHFFKSILSQSSCIFSLLPPPRDFNVTSRLRPASTYPRPTTRTKRYTYLICTTRIITLPKWIGQHHLTTQALSIASCIYYCYFCCIDI